VDGRVDDDSDFSKNENVEQGTNNKNLRTSCTSRYFVLLIACLMVSVAYHISGLASAWCCLGHVVFVS
jgi:hypothetical protein